MGVPGLIRTVGGGSNSSPKRTEWTATASEFLGALAELAGERIAIGEGRARTRMIRITATGKSASPETQGAQPSASSTPPADGRRPIPATPFIAGLDTATLRLPLTVSADRARNLRAHVA